MNGSLISRAVKSLAVVALVATAASCGGSESGRQRNSALPDTTNVAGEQSISFDVSWVPESKTASLSIPVDKIIVQFFADQELQQLVNNASIGPKQGSDPSQTSFEFPAGLTTDRATRVVVTAQFLDPESGDVVSSAAVEFDVSVGAVKSAEIRPRPLQNTSPDESTTTTSEPTTDTSTEDTTPVDTTTDVPGETTPENTTPTDTTIDEPSTDDTTSPAQDLRERISIQQVDCEAQFLAPTRTLRLCDTFDEIAVAGFEADGSFADVARGSGQSITLPENFIGEGRVSLLRIAVASKPEGIDLATFRGEGILEIGDGSFDANGGITISPDGSEALNTGGPTREMQVELNSTLRFDIDGFDETKFAFVTLNGVVYDYYENVVPPADWDEGKPLYWRAYALDGFGLPRLVAHGVLALREEIDLEYNDPYFALENQTVQQIGGDVATASDSCAGNPPYLITDPVTPSGSTRVTLTVDRDCDDPNGALGLSVWGENVYYDFFDDMRDRVWNLSDMTDLPALPVFSRMVSTRYTNRLEATIHLASGEYAIIWGDKAGVAGTHRYRVSAPESEISCSFPSVEIDEATGTGRLENCNTGNRMFRVYALPLEQRYSEAVKERRVPIKDGVLNFSGLPFDGPLALEIVIDDGPDGRLIVCYEDCGTLLDDERFTEELTVQTGNFANSGKVTGAFDCPADGDSWGGIDYFRKNSPTSWVWVQWMPAGPVSLPMTGEYYALGECWNSGTATGTFGSATFTVDGPMPNRPANDDFESAAEITRGIGRVKFSTVSATSQRGEMAPFRVAAPADEFRSVWFKRVVDNGESSVRFTLRDVDFSALVRVFRLTNDGRLGLVREWWWDANDEIDADAGRRSGRISRNRAPEGSVFYVQVLGRWVNDAGSAVLVINDGRGDEATVPAGNQPYTVEHNTTEIEPPVTGDSPTTTTPATSDTSAPDTSVPDTTEVSVPDTSEPTTSAPVTIDTDASDTTAPTTETSVPSDALQALYEAGIAAAAETDVAVVVAPEGSGPPVVEVREDARTVEIPVADLYATVAAQNPAVDTAQPLVVRTRGHRPVVVRPSEKTVSLPVAAGTSEVSITGADASGKSVTAPIQVASNQPPLVIVDDSESGSSVPWLWIVIALVALAGVGGFAVIRRRGQITQV